jgi:hypothetical protein
MGKTTIEFCQKRSLYLVRVWFQPNYIINFLTMMVEFNNDSSLIRCHHRVSQLHYEAMKEIIKSNMVIRLPNLLKPTTQCERCILRKQALTHFPNNSISKSKEILDLVHTNCEYNPTVMLNILLWLNLIFLIGKLLWIMNIKFIAP